MKKLLKAILVLIIYIAIVFIILWKTGSIEFTFLEKNKTPDEYIDNGLSLEDTTFTIEKKKEDQFYYNQLDKTAKTIYDKIVESTEELKAGNKEIAFTNHEFDDILSQDNGMGILSEKYQEAVDAIRYDQVDMFYVDFTKMALRTVTYTRGHNTSYEVFLSPINGKETYLQDELELENINLILEEIEMQSNQIIEEASGTDYQKIQYIHNWLIDNLEYDLTYTEENNRNIYGALINKNVVCEGYSKSFKYLLDKLEIPCILVAGNAVNSEGKTESHMWNYVRINGTWYAVDVTWDDPILKNVKELPDKYRYKYFCQGDNINSNHIITATITDGGKEFEYPELYHKE